MRTGITMQEREIWRERDQSKSLLTSLEQVMAEEIRNRPDGDVRKPELLLQLESLRAVWRIPVVFDPAIDEAMMQEIQSLPVGMSGGWANPPARDKEGGKKDVVVDV